MGICLSGWFGKTFSCGDTITTDVVNYNGDYTYGNAPKGKYLKQQQQQELFRPTSLVYMICTAMLWNGALMFGMIAMMVRQ